nr:MAG TPA: hypothetical protein [Caudoviricetes sp.]
MELKLNIYDKRKVVKTYTTDTYDLMTGTVEDVINLVDTKMFADDTNSIAFIGSFVKILAGAFHLFKPLLKEIFDGLTDEELRHTKMKDVANVLVAVVTFGLKQMDGLDDEKN